MKTPKYETSAGALLALLETRQFVTADLYTFHLVSSFATGGSSTLTYTTADTDIGYSATVWTHGGPLIDNPDQKALAHWKIGADTDTWQCIVVPRSVDPITGTAYPDKIGNASWAAACLGGMLDGAIVSVDRCYFASWPSRPYGPYISPVGVYNIFTGRVGPVDVGRTAVALTINSHMELLNIQMPRNLYGSGCRHVNKSTYAVSLTATAGSTSLQVNGVAGVPGGSGTYSMGNMIATSGNNDGFSRSIRYWGSNGSYPSSFVLMSPFPFSVNAGDTFTIYPGCDKQLSTCGNFGNTPNFGGMPYIPAPEVAT